MATDTVGILCGTCKTPIKGPTEPKPQDAIICTTCGKSDSFENVMRSVKQYSLDFFQKELNKTFEGSLGRNSFVQFKGKRVPHRSYPFIADL